MNDDVAERTCCGGVDFSNTHQARKKDPSCRKLVVPCRMGLSDRKGFNKFIAYLHLLFFGNPFLYNAAPQGQTFLICSNPQTSSCISLCRIYTRR